MLFETKGTTFTPSIKLNNNVDIIYPIVLCQKHLNSNNPCAVVTLIKFGNSISAVFSMISQLSLCT